MYRRFAHFTSQPPYSGLLPEPVAQACAQCLNHATGRHRRAGGCSWRPAAFAAAAAVTVHFIRTPGIWWRNPYLWSCGMCIRRDKRAAARTAVLVQVLAPACLSQALAWSPHNSALLASGGGTTDTCICIFNVRTDEIVQSKYTGSQVRVQLRCNLLSDRHSLS